MGKPNTIQQKDTLTSMCSKFCEKKNLISEGFTENIVSIKRDAQCQPKVFERETQYPA